MPQNKNSERESRWDYTTDFRRSSGEYYQGRRLIGRDTPISGGVYYGNYGGEALVVDVEKYPDAYNEWFNVAKEGATVDGEVKRNRVLQSVFNTVKDRMSYSKEGVDKILSMVAQKHGLDEFQDGMKLELALFMNSHVGVCRHQALAVGALLEMFKNQGYIRGDVSVDRNVNLKPNQEVGGHAWVRYTGSDETIIILDVAQNFIGTLEQSDEGAKWNYLRPEEKQQLSAHNLGKTAFKSL